MSNEALTAWATAAGAVATAAAAMVALWLGLGDRRRRKREDRQAQAVRVSAWYGSGVSDVVGNEALVILNASGLPIYNVVVALVLVQGSGSRTTKDLLKIEGLDDQIASVHTLPPGRWRVLVGMGWAGMSRWPGAEIAFTDAAGGHWIRSADGHLRGIRADPRQFYGLGYPAIYQDPRPLPGPDA